MRCEYDDGIARPARPPPKLLPSPEKIPVSVDSFQTTSLSQYQQDALAATKHPAAKPTEKPTTAYSTALLGLGPSRLTVTSREHTPRVSRGPSLEPTFTEGQHIGATAGVSFLYHKFNNGELADGGTSLPSAPLTCHGDVALIKVIHDQPMPTREEADLLLERYFRFATPTYRFLHRPTLEKWTSSTLNGTRLAAAETACALLVFSQALLFSKYGDIYVDGGDEDLIRSQFYFEKARSLLHQEPGPASVSSVQARLAMCLYLLSTFRINECRYCFSLACTISTSIGLHRKSSSNLKLDLVTLESRRRTFWCAYVLDDYMSVMLGQPRMIRDDDVDQQYPRNIDDQDLLSSEYTEDLPLHGNLEAFTAHADLAKLMGRNSDLLYPLQSLTADQLFERTQAMLDALHNWRERLPDFLKPREKTLAGHRTFERQNTVLKLAHAHLRILITRRCLLADFSRLGRRASSSFDDRALKPIQECANAINTILNATHDLVQRGALYQSFWFTQYIALVAISTLYVYIIQSSRANLPPNIVSGTDIMFDKAKLCQDHLAALAPEGTQARRHYQLLIRLRQRAQKDIIRAKHAEMRASTSERARVAAMAHKSAGTPHEDPTPSSTTTVLNQNVAISDGSSIGLATPAIDADATVTSQFTPSEDDFIFQTLLGWDWETLDTVGFPGDGDVFNPP